MKFEDVFHFLFDIIYLVVECLFLWANVEMSFLKRHCSLVKVCGHGDGKEDEEAPDTGDEDLAVAQHYTVVVVFY